ncbi:MAG: hypothetical protein AAFR36_13635, partial [Bacteroidota bacterium]
MAADCPYPKVISALPDFISSSLNQHIIMFSYTRASNLIMIIAIILSVQTLNSQSNDCSTLVDPLVDYLLDEDPCCGAFVSHQVCYTVDTLTIYPCSGNNYSIRLFEYPGGIWQGSLTTSGLDNIADSLNQILINNGVNGISFSLNTGTYQICTNNLDTIPSFGELTFEECITYDKIGISPEVITTNDCPFIAPNPEEMLSNTAPGDSTFIDGTVGVFTTNDIVGDIDTSTWAGPPVNTVGNMLNGLISSNALQLGAGCENINCLRDDLLNQLSDESWQPVYDSLMSDNSGLDIPAGTDLEAEILAATNAALDSIDQQYGSLASYVNSLFGFGFPDDPCPGGSGNLVGNPNEGAAKPNDKFRDLLKSTGGVDGTEASLDFFTEAIPGLGEGDPSSSAPSPSALDLIQSVKSGVNLYNGSQSTSIPLHNIIANDISIPIGLSSSNNGLKVNELGSIVGQNWALNAAGMVTRMVNGLPDEYSGSVGGMGVGRSYKLRGRFEIPSNLGFIIDFPGANSMFGVLCDSLHLVQTGFGHRIELIGNIDVPGGASGPVQLDIRWSPLEISNVNLNLSFPIAKIFGFTIKMEIGMKFGVALNEVLSNIEYQEFGLGYLQIDDGSQVGQFLGVDNPSSFPGLTEDFIDGLTDEEKLAYLRAIHPNRRFEDDRFLNNFQGDFDRWLEAIDRWLNDQVPVYNTRKIDVQADEFYFTAGGYSGKFYLNLQGEPILAPPVPGLSVDTVIMNGEDIASFEISTPEGLTYTYGRGDLYAVDFTQNTNYNLPNFYTYPEENPSRADFLEAEVAVSVLTQSPHVGPKKFITYGNTYHRNYKIMDAPEYASAWHLVSIHSMVTQEEVNFTYQLRDSLTYYANKSYNHTFPNFTIGGDATQRILQTTANSSLNFPHVDETKWENGRAEFSYNAVQTRLNRWDLASIETSRGEQAVFTYGQQRGEIAGDYLCSRVEIMRNSSLFKGWDLTYDYQIESTPTFDCDPYVLTGASPIAAASETVFDLGALYTPHWYEYYSYFFFNMRISCFTIPIRLPNVISTGIDNFGYRTQMSEFGSLMEIKAYPDPFEEERYNFDPLLEQAIFTAEGTRSYLREIKGIDQDGNNFEFITTIDYVGDGVLPKRFSIHQDVFGYHNDNSASGSPLPSVTYTDISGHTVSSLANGVELHFPFSNPSLPGSQMHLGQDQAINFSDVAKGALSRLEMASGASISFDYELNTLPDSTQGAGIRVLSRTEDPGDTPARVTNYAYAYPSFNNAPIRVFQKTTDRYFESLEQKVVTTSSIQNSLMPNGNGFIGYGQVTESWDGIGSVVHHFSTPDNFLDSLAIAEDGSLSYDCFEEERRSINDNTITTTNASTCETILDPALQIPSALRQCGSFFGLELWKQTNNAGGGLIQEIHNTYQHYNKGTQPKITLFNSSMNQYNHPGTFGEQFAYRQIPQFLPFSRSAIGDLLSTLLNLLTGNAIQHPYRRIDRYYQTLVNDYPSPIIRLTQQSTTNYPSGGGSNVSVSSYSYFESTGLEKTIDYTETNFSDGVAVKSTLGYAFQDTDSTINTYFDPAAITHLRDAGYLMPMHQKDSTRLSAGQNFILTSHSFTTITLGSSGDRILPEANYSLQDGVLTLRGYFEGDNGDALPENYYLAKFGATISSSASSFFAPVILTWTSQRQLATKQYLNYITTNTYSPFYQYAGTTDMNGVTTSYAYDKRARLEEQRAFNDRQITSYEYNIAPGENWMKASMALGSAPTQVTTQNIDGFGKVKSIVRENDGALLSSAQYDFFWRQVYTTALGRGGLENIYESSPLSLLLQTTDDEDNVFQYSYSAGGGAFNVSEVTDPNGHSIATSYNALEMMLSRSQEGSLTSYNYDNLLRLSSILNPIGELYDYDYNAMGKLYQTDVPGASPKTTWYDEKYRQVAMEDGNGHLFLYEYDQYDRLANTYLANSLSLSTNGIVDYSTISGALDPEERIASQVYLNDSGTFLASREDILLVPGSDTSFVFALFDTVDDLGRPLQTTLTYPDAQIVETISYNNAMQVTGIGKSIFHFGDTLDILETFTFDEVLRPSTHSIAYGDSTDELSRLVYNNEDQLVVKLLGKQDSLYLQQVDYYYDDIGRIIAINSFAGYECEVGNTVCELGLEFYLTDDEVENFECVNLESIEVDGQVYAFNS